MTYLRLLFEICLKFGFRVLKLAVTLMTKASCIKLPIMMLAHGGLWFATLHVVTIVTHALGVVRFILMWAICYVLKPLLGEELDKLILRQFFYSALEERFFLVVIEHSPCLIQKIIILLRARRYLGFPSLLPCLRNFPISLLSG